MKSSTEEILPIIGTSMGGGFYAGRIRIGEQVFALIVAPKAEGEHKVTPWNKSTKSVEGALSYFDGMANTKAMAEAGSKIAQWALDLRIGGHDDWYLPSHDELEVIYRNLKPTTEKNELWGCSGINSSAVPPTYPYTSDAPAQTLAEAFQAGGEQAFDEIGYWSSTQHAAFSDSAWRQDFDYSNQDYSRNDCYYRARAVRRLPI